MILTNYTGKGVFVSSKQCAGFFQWKYKGDEQGFQVPKMKHLSF